MCEARMKGNGHKLGHGEIPISFKGRFIFFMKTVKQWNQLFGEVMESPPLDMLNLIST